MANRHFREKSAEEAWNRANEIFPTDYAKDEESSQRAGYPIFRSTADGHFYDYICDLNDRLEVNLSTGETVNIWSDRYAATVIKVTKSSVTARRDKATLNPDFKPEWIPGGFAAHCTNQDEQTYTYQPDENGMEYTFRWSRKYQRYGQPGNLTLSKGRHEFYDYNF